MKLAKIIGLCMAAMFSHFIAAAQSLPSARSGGLGGSGAAIDGPEAVFTNPAALGQGNETSVILTSSMPFNIPSLVYSAAGAKFVFGPQQWIFSDISNLGFDVYRKSRLAIGYGRQLVGCLGVSIDLSLGIEYFEGYGSSIQIGYALGIFYEVSDQFSVGSYVRNPLPVPTGFPPATTFTLGTRFTASVHTRLYCDVFLQSHRALRIATGLEYDIVGRITLRSGISTRPNRFHLGSSFRLSDTIELAISASYNVILGISPSFDITFTP